MENMRKYKGNMMKYEGICAKHISTHWGMLGMRIQGTLGEYMVMGSSERLGPVWQETSHGW